MIKVRKQLWWAVLTLCLVVALTGSHTQAAGQSFVVEMTEPFEVSGEVFPAGELTVRELRAYSPVATLNEIQFEGRSLGLWLAREIPTRNDAVRTEIIFLRGPDGRLVLSALSRRGAPTRVFRDVDDLASSTDRTAWPEASGSMLH